MVFLFLHHKTQPFDLSAMFGAGGHNIDPGGINAAVTQDIRQLCNILLDPIKSSGKEFPQIVGKDLGRVHLGRMTQPLHLGPYVAAIQWFAGLGDENYTASDRAFLRITQ